MGFFEFFTASMSSEDGFNLFKPKIVKSAFIRKNRWGEYEVVAVRGGKETIITRTKNESVANDILRWTIKQ